MSTVNETFNGVEVAKKVEEFRNYVDSDRHDIVTNHYRLMRTHQTLEFVDKMLAKYSFKEPRQKMTIREAFTKLETYVDSSDPDVGLPNLVHMLQTAEGIRKLGHPEWMQLVGLIHDMGKIMFLWGDDSIGQNGTALGAQWALGGDTWVAGCRIPDCTVMPEFNKLNPDMANDKYNTELGIYQPNCGLENVKFAYGHDEYMYQFMKANNCTVPPEGYAMIRYHSCYPWHTGGAYRNLMTQADHDLLPWVLEFNKFDLYTKDDRPVEENYAANLWPYYEGLIAKFFPQAELNW
eukprot:gene13532-15574_t